MRLDSLVKLVEGTDFMAFRELAMLALRARGFDHVELRDGWKDGGSDVSVWTQPPNPTEIAVQVTVQQDWRGKIKTDAEKVAAALGLNRMIFVTNRRLAAAEFESVVDKVWKDHSVQVSRVDSQSIASLAIEHGLVHNILAIVGITISDRPEPADPSESIREGLAYALSLLSPDSRRFRRTVIETAIAVVLSDGTPRPRQELRDTVRGVGGLATNQAALVDGAIDRLLQSGTLISADQNGLQLSNDRRQALLATRDLRNGQWTLLRDDISSLVNEYALKARPSEGDVDVVLNALGGIIMTAGSASGNYLNPSIPHASVRDGVRAELRSVHSVLDSLGFPEGRHRSELFEEIAEAALDSDLGHHLLAGQFYIGLAAMDSSALSRALGSGASLEILLDSSVAIPLIAALLYEATPQELSRTAVHIYEQAKGHNIPLVVPHEYLEETAAHLVAAYRNYRALVEAEIDLRGSDNAFVAHYSALVDEYPDIEFAQYLKALGLHEEALKRDFYAARDLIMKRHEHIFARYGLKVRPRSRSSGTSYKEAQKITDMASLEKNIVRPDVLIAHDRNVLAHLMDADRELEGIQILCTWDNLHFYARGYLKDDKPRWDVLDPGVLGDLMASVSAGETRPPRGIIGVVLSLADEDAKKGMAIWDVIARIEGEKLFDAELMTAAQGFKDRFFADHPLSASDGTIRAAWARWKTDHGLLQEGNDAGFRG
ncbi:MAG: hypothetical protein WD942_12045 [Dehalococcoidia bacterium]